MYEQNGFRKGRACIDHIYALTSIIRNRKAKRKPTFACFVDFAKEFDCVDRKLLYCKLRHMGFNGNILKCIKAIYRQSKCVVSVNGHLTNCFPSNYGVRQGDTLSPTLFGLFINDLVSDICDNTIGI